MIEETLYNQLKTITEVEGRVYPQVAQDNPQKPYIVYTIVSAIDNISSSKSRTLVSTNYRIQIDIFDTKALSAKKLKDRVKISLYQLPSRPISLTNREIYEHEVKLYRQILDFNYLEKGVCDD